MKITLLARATLLSDADLLAHLAALAGREREATAELVAHLAALDARPGAYAAQGYGSLFTYCTKALRLSEDAACNRIEAARACRQFPSILNLLESGLLSLTTVRLLRRHLTQENHEAVLYRAQGRSRHEVDALIAEIAPRPDVQPSVRRLPDAGATRSASMPPLEPLPSLIAPMATARPNHSATPGPEAQPTAPRPIVEPTAPERYRIQFTVGREVYERLRRLQALLRREIPNGDPGAIFDRASTLLLEKVEKAKRGATSRAHDPAIRPGTDKVHKSAKATRYIPRLVRRAVWQRDGGRCAFVSAAGRRCEERTFLEFHHVKPYAMQGPATVTNLVLRCRCHYRFEAEVTFGLAHGGHGQRTTHDGPALPG